MPVLPKPELNNLVRTSHGGLNYAALLKENVQPEDVLDFSVCVNPFGMSPRVRDVIKAFAEHPAWIERYPDTKSQTLREKLACVLNISSEQILLTNGVSQAIWLIAFGFLTAGETVLILSPTYGEYEDACNLAGPKVEHIWCRGGDNLGDKGAGHESFIPDIKAITSRILTLHPRQVWLCNPNNPTGCYLCRADVLALLETCLEAGTLLIMDEAYLNFVQDQWSALDLLESGNLILLRSMTKDYALTGLRLGFILACPEHIDALVSVQPPWSVNTIAQEAGYAALESLSCYRGTWAELSNLTSSLYSYLKDSGLKVFPTQANFMLVETQDRAGLQKELWKKRILVRDCSSFGLPQCIRIGTRREQDNQRLIDSLNAWLNR